jgi:hypothetical protein
VRLFAIALVWVREPLCRVRSPELSSEGLIRSDEHTMVKYSCDVGGREVKCDRVPRYKNEAFRRGPSEKPSRSFQVPSPSLSSTPNVHRDVLVVSARSLAFIFRGRNGEN